MEFQPLLLYKATFKLLNAASGVLLGFFVHNCDFRPNALLSVFLYSVICVTTTYESLRQSQFSVISQKLGLALLCF